MRRFLAAAAAAGVSGAVSLAVRKRPELFASWERTSYSGAKVSLTGGLAGAAGALVGALIGAGTSAQRLGAAVAISSGALAGAIDDHYEDKFPAKGKGFKGHIGALREGKITSGALKIGVIGGGAALSAATIERRGGGLGSLVTWAGRTATIAGTANIINLLDLRPGRALKVTGVASAACLGVSPVSAAVTGASLAGLPEDLSGRTMLGDLGANALGGALGYTLASAKPAVMWSALTGVVGLTLASEKYSFSRIIETTPALAWADNLGRS